MRADYGHFHHDPINNRADSKHCIPGSGDPNFQCTGRSIDTSKIGGGSGNMARVKGDMWSSTGQKYFRFFPPTDVLPEHMKGASDIAFAVGSREAMRPDINRHWDLANDPDEDFVLIGPFKN